MPLLSFFSELRRPRAVREDVPRPWRKAFNRQQTPQFPFAIREPVAVLECGFRLRHGMCEFDSSEPDLRALAAFGPAAIVAPLHAALSLADQKLRGLLTLPSLQLALIVLTRVGEQPLEAHHRDLLWRAFGVPVFEQLRDSGGTVIARECEVHDGLHLCLQTGRAGSVSTAQLLSGAVTGQCECGAGTPRIRKPESGINKTQAAAA